MAVTRSRGRLELGIDNSLELSLRQRAGNGINVTVRPGTVDAQGLDPGGAQVSDIGEGAGFDFDFAVLAMRSRKTVRVKASH